MHQDIITCRPDTPIDEVAKTMDAKDISALVVVDELGDAIGVISRTDLVNARFIQPYMKHWRGMTAEHLMSKPVISVAPDTLINEAVQIIATEAHSSVGGGGRRERPHTARRHPLRDRLGQTCWRAVTLGGLTVADQETVFNPLENEGHEPAAVAGIKRPARLWKRMRLPLPTHI